VLESSDVLGAWDWLVSRQSLPPEAVGLFGQLRDCGGVEIRLHRAALYNSIYQADDQLLVLSEGKLLRVALVLAALGIYSVTAYTVAQQTNEIGVRMALGADRSRVVTHVLRGAFTWVLTGLVLGLPLAIAAGWAISEQLYLVSFWDPPAIGFASTTLAMAALVAALIPAMKAAGISPTTALRAN
jgi:predicted lysophospholipase L1 biosynthesis ABC-type transport system permease subunit